MSNKKKVLRVDKLIIHTNEVEIIQEQPKTEEVNTELPMRELPQRDPWAFLFGRRNPRIEQDEEQQLTEAQNTLETPEVVEEQKVVD